MCDYGDDPIEFCEDLASEAIRLAIALALLIGSALFALGFLVGRFL